MSTSDWGGNDRNPRYCPEIQKSHLWKKKQTNKNGGIHRNHSKRRNVGVHDSLNFQSKEGGSVRGVRPETHKETP